MSNEKRMKMDLDDAKETVTTFMDKIAAAQHNGDEFIETTPEIIMHYNRRGLNGAEYFIYNGIKVFPTGKSGEIIAHESEQIGHRMHGKEEGVLIGG